MLLTEVPVGRDVPVPCPWFLGDVVGERGASWLASLSVELPTELRVEPWEDRTLSTLGVP